MILKVIIESFGDILLALLDFFVGELIDSPTFQADDMIMMTTTIEFEDRIAAFKIMTTNQTGGLELSQHPVDSRQTNLFSFFEKKFVHVLGTQMVSILMLALQYLQDFHPWQGNFQTSISQILGFHYRSHFKFPISPPCRPTSNRVSLAICGGPGKQSMRKHLILITCFASLFLSGCAYKIDIQQGNVVTQAQVDQLRPGMPASKVRYVMGTPLLKDPLHPNRWDYVYSFQKGGGSRVIQHLTLFFDTQERLVSLQGDFRPHPKTGLAEPEIVTVTIPPRKIEKGIFELLGDFWRDLFS